MELVGAFCVLGVVENRFLVFARDIGRLEGELLRELYCGVSECRRP